VRTIIARWRAGFNVRAKVLNHDNFIASLRCFEKLVIYHWEQHQPENQDWNELVG